MEGVSEKWLVLWKNNLRIGSTPLTPEALLYLQCRFYMGLLQRDASGTEHWEVWGVKKGVKWC